MIDRVAIAVASNDVIAAIGQSMTTAPSSVSPPSDTPGHAGIQSSSGLRTADLATLAVRLVDVNLAKFKS